MSKILVERVVLEKALAWIHYHRRAYAIDEPIEERNLRAALAQPDQKPVAVREGVHEINGERGSSETTSVAFQYRREQVAKQMAGVYTAFGASHIVDADEALIQRSALAQQEPVASIYVTIGGEREFDDWRCPLPVGRNLLYTHPPRHEWKGLAEEEVDLIGKHLNETPGLNLTGYARNISRTVEALLKNRNNT
jgi:hypothetical protein